MFGGAQNRGIVLIKGTIRLSLILMGKFITTEMGKEIF